MNRKSRIMLGAFMGLSVLQPGVWAEDRTGASSRDRYTQRVDGPMHSPDAARSLDPAVQTISFQATLLDSSGLPLRTTPVDLIFNIYASALGPSVVEGPICVEDVAVARGIATAVVPITPSSFDGSARWIGVTVDETASCDTSAGELAPRLEVTAVPYALRVHSVENADLPDRMAVGESSQGSIAVYGATAGGRAVFLSGLPGYGRAELYQADGDSGIEMIGDSNGAGVIRVKKSDGTAGVEVRGISGADGASVIVVQDDGDTAARIFANDGDNGQVSIHDAAGTENIVLRGSTGKAVTTGGFRVKQELTEEAPSWASLEHGDLGGRLETYDASGVLRSEIAAGGDNASGSVAVFRGQDEQLGAKLVADDGGSNGALNLFGYTGTETASIFGTRDDNVGARVVLRDVEQNLLARMEVAEDLGGKLELFDLWTSPLDGHTEAQTLVIAKADDSGGVLRLYGYNLQGNVARIQLDGQNGGAIKSTNAFRLVDAIGATEHTYVQIDTHNAASQHHGLIDLNNGDGENTIRLVAKSDDGDMAIVSVSGKVRAKTATGVQSITLNGDDRRILMKDPNGDEVIILDADFGGSGKGRVITQELAITGGADLSERFEVSGSPHAIVPGSVVGIDPTEPGKLRLSDSPYDRAVAGIVSGAGGVATGMTMAHAGSIADGEHAVALTGRVYCLADASKGAIQPGDLLTTSDVPGHAMKVTDYDRAHGAVIGKAMTSLKQGRGLVLVLVGLQ